MNFPIEFSFKIIALASQIYVRDAQGLTIGYVKQKMFKLKEDIDVFSDEQQTRRLFNIRANKMLDFSATYTFTDNAGNKLGGIRREGMRSLWKATYHLLDAYDRPLATIQEADPMIKFLDGLVGQVPLVGMFSGYFLNPSYIAKAASGEDLMLLKKQPAFLEGKFQLSQIKQTDSQTESILLLGFLMMTLLEKSKG